MRNPRRLFLQTLAAPMVVALTLPAALRVAIAADTKADVDFESFSPLIASDFVVSQNGATAATLKLVNIEKPSALPGYRDPVAAARNSFTLILRSEQASALPEGIYTFSSPRLGSFSAFISPIGNDHRSYQIVYNRNTG